MQDEEALELVISIVSETESEALFGIVSSELFRRFELTGSKDDIDRAITMAERTIASAPDDHPDRGVRLHNLANSLQRRFERLGSMEDIDRAVKISEQALPSTLCDDPDRPVMLTVFGNCLARRFERTGSIDDIDRAIKASKQAVKSRPDDDPNRAMFLNNLVLGLVRRFQATRPMDDLDAMKMTTELAATSIPDDSSHRGMVLNGLAVALVFLYEQTGSMDDLNRGIRTYEQGLASTADDHPNSGMYLNNLGIALQDRFERTGSIDDLERAIATIECAVGSTRDSPPNRAIYLKNLGNAPRGRFVLTESIDDLDRATRTMEEAFAANTAPPSIRLEAAQSCSELLIGQKAYNRASPILKRAVRLLPTISPRTLKAIDQQHNISRFSNITSRAVSLSLADGDDPYRSLQLLELGRGIIVNLQLQVRSDISMLSGSRPDLAQQFQELRNQIDPPSRTFDSSAISNSTSILDSSKSIAERCALIKRFDDLLRSIRSLHGFDNFLQGPSESELHSLAENGPIVIFNVSDIRSDAFLITTDEIRSVHLPLLTSDSVEDFAKHFFDAINERDPNRYRHATRDMNGVLRGLWDFAVKPILDELGFTKFLAVRLGTGYGGLEMGY